MPPVSLNMPVEIACNSNPEPTELMHTKIETITPEKATEYLGKNTHNRKLRQKHVEALANEMRNGNWVVTHQGIAFSDKGELIDGQHRMAACILCKKTIEVLVSRHVAANGHPFCAQDVIDRGSIRSIGDQLQLSQGLKNAFVATSSARWIISVFLNHATSTPSLGNIQQVLEMYEEDIQVTYRHLTPTSIFRKAWIIGSIALARHVHAEEVDEMSRKLGNGIDLRGGDPILALRNWLIDIGGSNRGNDRAAKEMVLNALHHSLTGNQIKKVFIGVKGLDYFTSRQEKEIKKIRSLFGYKQDLKVSSVMKKNSKKNLSQA